MKTKIFWKWSLGISLAVVPFLGCGQRSTATYSAPAVVQGQPMVSNFVEEPAVLSGDEALPEEADQDLANAPAELVSPAKLADRISPAAAELVKLAQAGVDESVMMAFVTNSTLVFNLTSDDIVYLNDVGVPGSVVTAMIQRDASVKGTSATTPASAPTPINGTNELVQIPGAPIPYAAPAVGTDPQTTIMEEPSPQPGQVNVSYTYFYESLAPYGSWIDVKGYGLCWQPTVVVVNPGWQPYGDRGRWIYSDHGWYWASDYSWGWAPFHYGRWFQHSRWGWCWAPDTVWGPSWVSWRYTRDYCGWAPLPPAACYSPGFGFTYYGRSVGVNFGFGLSAHHYAFVPVSSFCDRNPYRYRVHDRTRMDVFHRSTVVQRYDHGERNRVINRGIPVEHVRSATRAEIRPVPIRDMDQPSNSRFVRADRDNARQLAVFRPELPQPEGRTRLVGEGVRAGTPVRPRASVATPPGVTRNDNSGQPGSALLTPRQTGRDRDGRAPFVRNNPNPNAPNTVSPAPTTPRSVRNTTPTVNDAAPGNVRQPEPLILRGRDRSGGAANNALPPRVAPARPEQNSPREVIRPNAPTAPVQTPIKVQSTPSTPNPAPVFQPRVRQVQPAPTTPTIRPEPTPRVFQPVPQRNVPVQNFTPAPIPRQQQPAPFQPAPRVEPRVNTRIEPPRVNTRIEQRAPARVETPAPRIERPSPPASVPSIRPAPSQPQPSGRPDRGGGGRPDAGRQRQR